jgi:hypothetical protein
MYLIQNHLKELKKEQSTLLQSLLLLEGLELEPQRVFNGSEQWCTSYKTFKGAS